ncbi:MAG: hypothetical protein FWG87_09830 [Defluviitaleaceae bacterium]|nr:hypothetical protein [Defluviitaleaceae bacterium]
MTRKRKRKPSKPCRGRIYPSRGTHVRQFLGRVTSIKAERGNLGTDKSVLYKEPAFVHLSWILQGTRLTKKCKPSKPCRGRIYPSRVLQVFV